MGQVYPRPRKYVGRNSYRKLYKCIPLGEEEVNFLNKIFAGRGRTCRVGMVNLAFQRVYRGRVKRSSTF